MIALKIAIQLANQMSLMIVFVLAVKKTSDTLYNWPQLYRQLISGALIGLAVTAGWLGWIWLEPISQAWVLAFTLFTSAAGWAVVRQWLCVEERASGLKQTEIPSSGILLSGQVLPVERELSGNVKIGIPSAADGSLPIAITQEEAASVDCTYRRHLKEELAGALERGELHLHYQPQFHTSACQIRGFEALLRWSHPELGSVPPDQFIPIAEETGSIVAIGEWVLREACRINLFLQRAERLPTVMCVNISALQLQDPFFANRIGVILKETGLSPATLELEITESMQIVSWDAAAKTVAELHRLGVRIALDDFGTGYATLSYLQRLPIHLVKIDRSFVQGLPHSTREKALVESVIRLVHQLGIGVLAEGIEKEEQLECLNGFSCNFVQGYLLARPMDSEALSAYIQAYREGREAALI